MVANKDNRSYPRAKIDFEVSYSTDHDGVYLNSQANDVSATGISFQCEEQFEKGDVVYLKLSLRELNKEIPAKANIVRTWNDDSSYVSAQFMEIDYHDFITLLDYSLAFQLD